MAIQGTADKERRRSWQEIAQEVTNEHDPVKVRKLSVELNQAMLDAERRKVRLRFGCLLMNNSLMTDGPQCAVCGKPVKLEASRTNETGKAIHSECAAQSNERETQQHQSAHRAAS